MKRDLVRTLIAVLVAARLAPGGVSRAAESCDPLTGSPPAEVFLGPRGEQFFPQNTACPDRIVAPVCEGGRRLVYRDDQDPDHLVRYACVSASEASAPLPLLVFLHPSRIDSVDYVFGGSPDRKPATSLLAQSATASLGSARGYVLLTPQGRCLRAPSESSGDGTRFDVFYKDRERNLDVRAIRAFIQQVTAQRTFDDAGRTVSLAGAVAPIDAKRVYLMDWSNGGYMAHFLALSWPNEFTAAVSFASADPFARSPCPVPYPAVSRKPPIAVVHAECDPVLACSEVEDWLAALRGLGWPSSSLLDVVTDASHVQRVRACETLTPSQQRQCPAAAHFLFANPQVPTMFEFLRRFRR